MRVLIEYALSLLPFEVSFFVEIFFGTISSDFLKKDVTVETPQGLIYTGKKHVYADVSVRFINREMREKCFFDG
jgi:hypothetical protein